MTNNRNNRKALPANTKGRLSNAALWGSVEKHFFSKQAVESFPILVRLAKRGSPKAQFLAYTLEIIAPHLSVTPDGEKLDTLKVTANPFKNIKANHKLYSILSLNPHTLVHDIAQAPTTFTSLIAALHCIAKPSKTKTNGLALDLFLKAASMDNLTGIPYFKKLIATNTIDLIDSIKHYKPKENPTSVEFKDGSKRPVSTVSKALSELERLCARSAPK